MAKRLKDISFNYSHGELRNETVACEGYKPFEITFTVPGGVGKLAYGMDINDVGKGKATVNFIHAHMKSWTLEKPYSEKELTAIDDVMILAEIANTIDGAGNKAKN